MAGAFSLRVEPRMDDTGTLETTINFSPYRIDNFSAVADAWLAMSFALNNINRSMGQPDFYPFVLSQPVIDKLQYIHDLVRAS